ncbi:DUF1206 domain-containing protein [Brevundimonas kwangchunensis]|uniref:DUF1206 domain-containing protein n=1 Tax=Brevundimonas kwangchunensis TaxID=322163 RepID=A0ABN1GJS9_9CAUL
MDVHARLARLINRIPRPGRRRRSNAVRDGVEIAARVGYGARGFVYLSAGLIILLSSADLVEGAVGTRGAMAWLGLQPLGRAWLLLLGLGLTAFVAWRLMQSIMDADNEGRSWQGMNTRISQGFSGLGYAFLAISAFALLIHTPADPVTEEARTGTEQAARVLSLPFGNWLLIGIGLCILGVGVANIVRAWREDFTQYLSCSVDLCRRVAPLARIGYMARGLAWLPLSALVIAAGLHAEPSEVTGFGGALDALDRQVAGPWLLGAAALGFIAFGAFSFIEARFRRIRPPRELVSG